MRNKLATSHESFISKLTVFLFIFEVLVLRLPQWTWPVFY